VGPLGNAADYTADYAADYAFEDEPLLTARAHAADLGGTEPVRPAVGAALRFIASAVGARAAVEVGTGCGSSGIWLLRGMRAGGTLTTVDTEPEYQRMARQAFTQAGFAANQSRLILGRALDVLPRLSDGAYDIVFCDVDATDYPDYLRAALRLLRAGGVVVFNDALPRPGSVPELPGLPGSPGLSGLPGSPGSPGAGGSVSAFGSGGSGSSLSQQYSGQSGHSGQEYYGGQFSGGLAEVSSREPDVASIVRDDERLVPMLLPLGDGLLAAVKR
jgi:predicted O-methyltransferase YrrM